MKARACEQPLHRLACMHAHGRTSSPARLSDGASDTTPCLTRGTPRCATPQIFASHTRTCTRSENAQGRATVRIFGVA